MPIIKGRLKIFVLGALIAVVSAGAGFYVGFGRGARTMAVLASQNVISNALGDVERSVVALEANDPALVRKKVTTDLRLALFSLDGYSSAVPFAGCHERDRKALEKAASYIAAHPDPSLLNGAPELARGLKFCVGRSS